MTKSMKSRYIPRAPWNSLGYWGKVNISVAGLENFSKSHSRSKESWIEKWEKKSREATLPLKIQQCRKCSFTELCNNNSILLWDEGKKYFPDFPLYVFIITAALNFAIGRKMRFFYLFILLVPAVCSCSFFLFQPLLHVRIKVWCITDW